MAANARRDNRRAAGAIDAGLYRGLDERLLAVQSGAEWP